MTEATGTNENGAAKTGAWDEAKKASATTDSARIEKSAPRVGRYDVSLSAIERLALGAKIAQTDADVEKLEADKKSAVAEWNGKIEGASAELRSMCATLRKGAEERDVRVIDVKDFGTNTYRVIDADTGFIYFERALEARERQADLLAQSAIKKAAEAKPEDAKTAEPEAPAAAAPDATSFDAGAVVPPKPADAEKHKRSKKEGGAPES